MLHDQAVRYSRNISLPQIGEAGQRRLLASSVLSVGAGGLGAPLLLYLAAAGVGRLGIADHDRVALSNLQRQVLYETAEIGRYKAEAARDALLERNPDIAIEAHAVRLTAENADTLIDAYDLVADCSDNFETRYLLADRCMALGKTLVSAAVIGFGGQLYTFKPHLGAPHPCYRCLSPEPPGAENAPRCADSGVLGSAAGVMGCLQATEVVKELLGIGKSLSGQVLIYDALGAGFRKLALPRDPECPGCGGMQKGQR